MEAGVASHGIACLPRSRFMTIDANTKTTAVQPDDQNPEAAKTLQAHPVGVRTLIVLAVGFVICAAAVFASRSRTPLGSSQQDRRTHRVERTNLVVKVTEQGTIESSRNTEIKCRIRGGYGGQGGQSTVTYVIPSGTNVQKGDVLVRLDTRVIEETVSLGKTDTNNATAQLARTQADLAALEIAVSAYENGRYRARRKALDKRLEIAQWNLQTAEKMLRDAEQLFEKGYVTDLEVKGHGYALEQAKLELQITETEIDVLQRLTRTMELEGLKENLNAVRARLEGHTAGLRLEQGRLDLAEQELKNCVIRAEKDGLVIYPSTAKWKDSPDVTAGASVRNNQVLLLMPDLARMQVSIGIHESIIDRVREGHDVKITLANQIIDAKVTSVAAVASSAGWWSGNDVRYETTIQLNDIEGLKPGMTAQAEIELARYENVLTVPVECVVESESGIEPRAVQLGDSNDEMIIVKAGLNPNELVIFDPLKSAPAAAQTVQADQAVTVSRDDMDITLIEQGLLESSNNTAIKCRVRGSSQINWVIDSGTQVQPGDELVRLENKQIEEYLHERTKFAFLSRDAAITAQADVRRAELAISEYLEGRYRTELMRLQQNLAVAEERLNTAESMRNHANLMFERGYVSEAEVEQKMDLVREARLDIGILKTDIRSLQQFAKEEQLVTLRGELESARAKAEGHDEVLRMDEARVELARQEIERCVIRAEKAGLVIYPRQEEWEKAPDVAEGATVHNDQVLLLMPDLTQMQVKVGVHETMIDNIAVGMKAFVTLPNRTLDGVVKSVASTAEPPTWWSGNVVNYDVVIELPSVDGLKPGMTAEVRIFMAEHKDVLQIPMSAVYETDEGSFCHVITQQGPTPRKLELGDNNDSFVIVRDGLAAGERVLRNPDFD